MAIPKSENHHFLPRCYLKLFSENRKFVHVYSKVHKRHGTAQGIHNVAVKENFYRISLDSIQSDDKSPEDVNFFETGFFDRIVERQFSPLLTSITEKATIWTQNKDRIEVLNTIELDTFAALIAIQYLRMPDIREKYCSFWENLADARLEMMKVFFINQFPDSKEFIESIILDYQRELDPDLHAEIYANQELVNNIQDCLLDKVWIFYVSPHDDFYTSDNPILIKPHVENKPSRLEGFDQYGCEIIFPISSSVLLTLWDKHY
ncbi:MAG: DUF4238 domain-containing protein, partial [Chitinophagaceae bacterium]